MMNTANESKEVNTSEEISAPVVSAPPSLDIEKLFSQHRVHLLRFVQRYVRKLEDAEDVVQNTFFEAMRCADRFSGLSKPSTWLFGIALNLARNQVRRNCADMYEVVDEEFMEGIVDVNSDPARLIELRELAKLVGMCLDELPEKIRATFEAVVDGEASYEQVAEALQIPIGTVRSRVSRVRAAVRSEFGET